MDTVKSLPHKYTFYSSMYNNYIGRSNTYFYINNVAAVVPADDDFNSAECIEPLAHTHYGWYEEHGGVSHSGPVGGEVSNECYSGGKASIRLPHYLSIHPSISSSIHRSVHLPPHCHAEREGPRAHFWMRWRGYGQCRRAVSGSQEKERAFAKMKAWRKRVVEKMTQTGWTGQSAMARGNDRKSANRIERVFLSPAVPNLAWLSLSVAMGGAWRWSLLTRSVSAISEAGYLLSRHRRAGIRGGNGREWQSRRNHADGWCSSLIWCDLTAKVRGWRWSRSTSAVFIARCCRTKWQFWISCRFTEHNENICFVYLFSHQKNSVMLASNTVVLSLVST